LWDIFIPIPNMYGLMLNTKYNELFQSFYNGTLFDINN